MCLTITKRNGDQWFRRLPRAKIAEQAIECFKIVARRRHKASGTYSYHSTIRNYEYKLGKIYTTDLNIEERSPWRTDRSLKRVAQNLYNVNAGYHSYGSYELAHTAMLVVGGKRANVIVRCIMPKGSRYYTEWHYSSKRGLEPLYYVSTGLKITKVVISLKELLNSQ